MPLRLIIAATRGELEPLLGVLEDLRPLPLRYGEAVGGNLNGGPLALATLGVGKVNTAAGLALAIDALRPAAVVQIGLGGAFPDAGLDIGEAAVASEEVHLDSGALTGSGFEEMEAIGFRLLTSPRKVFNRVPVDADLSKELAGNSLRLLPFGTSETVTGDRDDVPELALRYGVAIESMEGAAAAQVSLALAVPFAEVRGVSNEVGERDKKNWRIEEALEAAHRALSEWLILPATTTTPR